jgi:hypothetical protein
MSILVVGENAELDFHDTAVVPKPNCTTFCPKIFDG